MVRTERILKINAETLKISGKRRKTKERED